MQGDTDNDGEEGLDANTPAPSLPFVCDGRVDEEKLYELLNAAAEFPTLDFKQSLDLRDQRKKLDFIKDCTAMMNLPHGGYIVVGAKDNGHLASDAEPPQKSTFDSASLSEIVRGYVDSHVDIRAQFHPCARTAAGTGPMVLIYVAPPVDGLPAVISKDGSWTGDGRPKFVLRAGTVYTRMGTSNVLATHQTWSMILENYRNRVHANAQSDIQALVKRVVEQIGSPDVREERVAPDVAMDPDTFATAVKRNLDDNHINPLKRFLIQAKAQYQASKDPSGEDKTTALDRITALACEALSLGNYEVLEASLATLDSLYRSHLDSPTGLYGSSTDAPARWLEIILRLHVIGSLAVRTEAWEVVPLIVLHNIGDSTYSYQSWMRHGLTEAARSNLLNSDSNRATGGILLSWARGLASNHPELRPDIPGTELPAVEGTDPLLDSLCQWDFLWCCIALSRGEGRDSDFYPSCAAFHQHRTDPILHTLDSNQDVRMRLFSDADDELVASSIDTVVAVAKRESWNYGGYWEGTDRLSPKGFVRAHATDN